MTRMLAVFSSGSMATGRGWARSFSGGVWDRTG
jgi:hypothetical protein